MSRRSGRVSEHDLTSAQVFELNMWRAWGAVATTVASVALSVYLIAISPWYLLPLAWAFAGTAWTGVRLRLGTGCLCFSSSQQLCMLCSETPAALGVKLARIVFRNNDATGLSVAWSGRRSCLLSATTAGTAASARTSYWRTSWARSRSCR